MKTVKVLELSVGDTFLWRQTNRKILVQEVNRDETSTSLTCLVIDNGKTIHPRWLNNHRVRKHCEVAECQKNTTS